MFALQRYIRPLLIAHLASALFMVGLIWTIHNAFSANTQDGIIATTNITLNPDGSVIVDKPGVYPIWVDKKNGVVVRPVIADLADPSVPKNIKDDLKTSLNRTRSVVGNFIATAP